MAGHRRAAAAADDAADACSRVVAVALAAVGVYGVMAYTVVAAHSRDRRADGGRRLAARVVGMVVWQGARLALIGIGLGLVAAAFAARAVQSLLFDVRGLDPLTFTSHRPRSAPRRCSRATFLRVARRGCLRSLR